MDKSDTMISSIDWALKTLKWYKKFFSHLIDITMLNVHIIHRIKSGKKCKLEENVLELIRHLLSEYVLERPAPILHSASGNPTRLNGRHFIRTMKASPESRIKRGQRACYCANTQHAASNTTEIPASTAENVTLTGTMFWRIPHAGTVLKPWTLKRMKYESKNTIGKKKKLDWT